LIVHFERGERPQERPSKDPSVIRIIWFSIIGFTGSLAGADDESVVVVVDDDDDDEEEDDEVVLVVLVADSVDVGDGFVELASTCSKSSSGIDPFSKNKTLQK
jgi:hypothetical protein